MRDYDGVPEQSPEPHDKYVSVAHCPTCDSDELGEMVIIKEWRRIIAWRNESPWKMEEEDRDDVMYETPRFYCFNCEDEF